MKSSNPMLVSTTTVTRNRKQDLAELRKSLLKQKYKKKEMIVVDNASTDSTTELLNRYAPVKVIRLDKNYGLHKGFNLGVEKTKGKIITGINRATFYKDWFSNYNNCGK